jgi:hypothetical protein
MVNEFGIKIIERRIKMDDLQAEKNRIEDQQLQNFTEKRAASVQKLHRRLEKIKKLQERGNKK